MWDEQYYALANLIRRPMRRWWTRVGSWWLLGIGLLLVARLVLTAHEVHLEITGNPVLPFNQPSWYQLLSGLTWLSIPIAVGVALLCANQVISTIARATSGTAVFSRSALMVHSYRLSTINCWPALIPIQIYWVIFGFKMHHRLEVDNTFWLLVTFSIWWMLHYAIWVIWLVAIAIVVNKPGWQMWLLYAAWLLPASIESLLQYGLISPTGLFGLSSSLFPNYQSLELSDIVGTALTGVGLLLIYVIPILYLLGITKVANAILVYLSIAMLGAGLYVGFGVPIVDFIIQFGARLDDGLIPVRCFYIPSLGSALHGEVGGFRFRYSAGPLFAIVPVLVSAIQLLVPYFAISWLMRTVRPPASSDP